jgi:hypothetical protein
MKRFLIPTLVVGAVLFIVVMYQASSEDLTTTVTGPGAIDWDRPIPNGITVSGARQAQDYVDFKVPAPRLAGVTRRVMVSNPEWSPDESLRSVVFVYDVPTAGRVLRTIRRTDASQADLVAASESTAFPPGTFELVSIAGGKGLLTKGRGLGRLEWLADGLLFDLSGPAVTPAQAIALAKTV